MKNSKLEEHDKMLVETRERLLSNPPRAQKAFEKKLKDAQIDFDHEVIIGFYIADIVIPHKMLVIEIDGSIHEEIRQRTRDKWKDKSLYYDAAFHVSHIPNGQVETYPLARIELFPDVHEGMCQEAIDLAYDEKKRRLAKEEEEEEWENAVRRNASEKPVIYNSSDSSEFVRVQCSGCGKELEIHKSTRISSPYLCEPCRSKSRRGRRP